MSNKKTPEEIKIAKDKAKAKYREKNRDLLNEKNKLYRKNNPEIVKQSCDNWAKNNRDKVNAHAKKYRDRQPPNIKKLWDGWYSNNKERVRFSKLKRIYGLTKEDYEAMLHQQKNCCAICNISVEEVRDNVLVVDHCHETGKIRGLLCHCCNTGLGLFRDNQDNILKAHNYLVHNSFTDGIPQKNYDGQCQVISVIDHRETDL